MHLLYFLILHLINATFALNFTVVSILPCDEKKHYPITFRSTIAGNTIVQGIFNLSIPYGGFPVRYSIYYSVDSGKFLPLVKLTDNDACEGANKYAGELWHDIEREFHIQPVGQCPVRKGVYIMRNVTMNMNRSRFQAIPYGFIKCKIEGFDKVNKTEYMCFMINGQNI